MTRILISCTVCGETIQTDPDLATTDPETFAELLDNFGWDDKGHDDGHTHVLCHEEVS